MCSGNQQKANKPTMMASDLAACTSFCRVDEDELGDEAVSVAEGAWEILRQINRSWRRAAMKMLAYRTSMTNRGTRTQPKKLK